MKGVLCAHCLDRRRVEFSGLCHDRGLDEPPGFSNEIGGLLPIALMGPRKLDQS